MESLEPMESGMKRIVVETPDDFHRKVKAKCYSEGRTIKEVILEILTYYLEDDEDKSKEKK